MPIDEGPISLGEQYLVEFQKMNRLLEQILEAVQSTGAAALFTPEESEELHGFGCDHVETQPDLSIRDRLEVFRIASEHQIGGVDGVISDYHRIMEAITEMPETNSNKEHQD